MQKRHQKQFAEVRVNNAAVISTDVRNRTWMRCRITEIIDKSRVEVLCVDTGEIKVVANTSLISMRSDFSEFPPLAMECRLACVELSSDRMRLAKITELADYFKKSHYKMTVKTKSVVKTAHTLVHSVTVYFINASFKLNFNSIIAGLKLASTHSDFPIDNSYVKIFNTKSNEKVIEVDSIAKTSTPANVQLNLANRNKGEPQ